MIRVVNLSYRDGRRVCAPLFVSIDRRNYDPTDIEFEEEAVQFALRDGLVTRRGDVVAQVSANE